MAVPVRNLVSRTGTANRHTGLGMGAQRKSRAEIALAMLDAGRSKSAVACRLGISVHEVEALVVPLKVERRDALSRTHRNEEARGLPTACSDPLCRHPKGDHDGKHHDGACRMCGPRRVVWLLTVEVDSYVYEVELDHEPDLDETDCADVDELKRCLRVDWAGCDAFALPLEYPGYSPPRLSHNLGYEAHALGMLRSGFDPRTDVPIGTKVRRARRLARRKEWEKALGKGPRVRIG